MKLQYSMAHEPFLQKETREHLIGLMKDAGIEKVWIAGFFSGRMVNLEELKEAKSFAESRGLEVGAVTIPIGHPGNSLNPDDLDLELEIPKHWHYRVDKTGQTVYYCGAIDDPLIRDNATAARLLRDAGFREVFLDDDLRVGNWNPEIEGCFCEACVAEFNRIYGRQETLETLAERLTNKTDLDVMKDWVAFQCGKVTDVVKATDGEGVRAGIMVMHFGDERHGIDIPAIRKEVPDALFRVGELHFNDATFGKPEGKASEMMSIRYHLNFLDVGTAFSESTIFPPRSLKEHNLVYKAKMAVAAGMENILFMSGTWMLDDSYWKALAEARDSLRDLYRACAGSNRKYPVHLAYGTNGAYAEAFVPSTLPLLAGLPVKPLRADQSGEGGELLLFFGDYSLSTEWQLKLPLYKKVVFDQKAVERNRETLQELYQAGVRMAIWNHEAGSLPADEEILWLQEFLNRDAWEFPRIVEGRDIGVIWLGDSGKAILFNLSETENRGVLDMANKQHAIRLQPLSFAVIDGSGSLAEFPVQTV